MDLRKNICTELDDVSDKVQVYWALRRQPDLEIGSLHYNQAKKK